MRHDNGGKRYFTKVEAAKYVGREVATNATPLSGGLKAKIVAVDCVGPNRYELRDDRGYTYKKSCNNGLYVTE